MLTAISRPAIESKSTDGYMEIDLNNTTTVLINDDLSWGVGAIQPQSSLEGDAERQQLQEAVLANLKPVASDELAYSSCTDGRLPVQLVSGEKVPVRQQNVGTDTMVCFHMAEVLGADFYKDPTAPLAQRLRDVVMWMRDNDLTPSTHIGCGAAVGYVAITQNLVDFTQDPVFTARQKELLPEGVYDDDIRNEITKGYQDRLTANAYADWSDAMLVDVIKHVSGERAIAQLQDDGRGVHGHVEEQIIRLKLTDDVALDTAKLAEQTNGRQVFAVNDVRMQRLARMMAGDNERAYRMALMAAEDFTDGGHGTLAKNLPTYIVRAV